MSDEGHDKVLAQITYAGNGLTLIGSFFLIVGLLAVKELRATVLSRIVLWIALRLTSLVLCSPSCSVTFCGGHQRWCKWLDMSAGFTLLTYSFRCRRQPGRRSWQYILSWYIWDAPSGPNWSGCTMALLCLLPWQLPSLFNWPVEVTLSNQTILGTTTRPVLSHMNKNVHSLKRTTSGGVCCGCTRGGVGSHICLFRGFRNSFFCSYQSHWRRRVHVATETRREAKKKRNWIQCSVFVGLPLLLGSQSGNWNIESLWC